MSVKTFAHISGGSLQMKSGKLSETGGMATSDVWLHLQLDGEAHRGSTFRLNAPSACFRFPPACGIA